MPMTQETTFLRSVRALMSGIIDYAGLFPPSKLPMERAVLNYASYRLGTNAWLLGRFVAPVTELTEFVSIARSVEPVPAEPWRLSATAGGNLRDAFALVSEFNSKFGDSYRIDTVEFKCASENEIAAAARDLPEGLTAYAEVEAGDRLAELVAEAARCGLNAKLRTGGVTADAFPAASEVVRFIRVCTAAGVPFKATAGLHHPLRCVKPFTYEPDSAVGAMHGFLNVALAAGFASTGCGADELEAIMQEDSPDAFAFSEDGVSWRGRRSLSTEGIERIRGQAMHSFGSCSFTEPIEDLRSIGLL